MIKSLSLLLFILLPIMNWAGSGNSVLPSEEKPDLYSILNLSEKGLSPEAFRLAIKGQQKLDQEGKLKNTGIITIADFSQSSCHKRLYVIDLRNKVILFNTYVAHGRNTGDEFAKNFSNVSGSYKSSLGFYITREEITGSSVGKSLVLEGVEKGFNDNALQREIIMHGAEYATENFIKRTGRLGRSFGCPSLPPDLVKPVIETIKEGTCLFIYSGNEQYISHSRLLN